jgi:hypothetical protein
LNEAEERVRKRCRKPAIGFADTADGSIKERHIIDLRKLAAIDIVFLGPRVILVEYLFGVVFPLALGIFISAREHARWQIALGIYILCLAINYAPMLSWVSGTVSNMGARPSK